MRRVLGLLSIMTVVILASPGCEGEFLATGPVGTCREVATQCQTVKGPLGVCERRACRADEAPPCFECTPQH